MSPCIKRYHRAKHCIDFWQAFKKCLLSRKWFKFHFKRKEALSLTLLKCYVTSVCDVGIFLVQQVPSVCLTYFYFTLWFPTFPRMAFEESQRRTSFIQLLVLYEGGERSNNSNTVSNFPVLFLSIKFYSHNKESWFFSRPMSNVMPIKLIELN